MRRKIVVSGLLAALACGGFSAGAAAADQKQDAIMVLDASGSMWGQIDEVAKIVIARQVIDEMLGGWSANVDLGLMAYGHRRKGDCKDIEVLRGVAPVDQASFVEAVNAIKPKGKTPITAAVQMAAEQLRYTEEKATVILVSDGLETCSGDPCALAAELEASGVDFTAHVVGFGVSADESAQLACIAENTGGLYLSAANADELSAALERTAVVVADPPPAPAPAPKAPESIADLDLEGMSFDVTSIEKDAASGKVIAKGTSNGVGFTIVADNIYKPYSNMDGGVSYNDLPGIYDDLHLGSNFTLTFDQPVESALFAFENDNPTGDGPHFLKFTPRDVIDAKVDPDGDGGAQISITDINGALMWYDGIGLGPMVHVNDNGVNDGWDISFFVFPKAE